MLSKTLHSAHPLSLALAVSGLATGASYLAPVDLSGSLVALIFLVATYFFALARSAQSPPAHYGLSLGGLMEAAPLEPARMVRESARAILWASLTALVVLPLFWFGFELWYQPEQDFSWSRALDGGDDLKGGFVFLFDLTMSHLLVVALPEEAFFRGYLQSALDESLKFRVRILGANLGLSLVLVSALFALGHFATTGAPGRLAVFFPSLLFGYARARTGGIGAPLVLHAQFNVAAALLGRGFGLY